MRRAVGFGTTLLVLGALFAAGAWEMPGWRLALLAGAAVYGVLGFLVLALRPTHTSGDDVMVGFLLFRMPRLAMALAMAEDVLLVGGLALLLAGFGGAAWVPAAMPAFLTLSIVACAIAGVGLTAAVWSIGRGTAHRRGRAAGGLVTAIALALVPWGIRLILAA